MCLRAPVTLLLAGEPALPLSMQVLADCTQCPWRRRDFGNTPDTSKALRLLVTSKKVLRKGRGGRHDPFLYQLPASLLSSMTQPEPSSPAVEVRCPVPLLRKGCLIPWTCRIGFRMGVGQSRCPYAEVLSGVHVV